MKRLIGLGTGAVGMGALLLAGCSSAPQATTALASPFPSPAAPTYFNCGEGRQAFVQQVNGVNVVQCANTLPGDSNQVLAYVPPGSSGPIAAPLQDRIVYGGAVAPRTVSTSDDPAPYRTYPRERVYVKRGRTWKKSAAIIGGSTAAGAGLGAVLGGGSGAKKGAVVGLIGGTVYDIATRSK